MLVPVEKEENYKAIIKRVLIFNPSISVLNLQQQLKESSSPIDLGRPYLTKLVKMVRQESADRVSRETKEEIAAQFTDLVEYVNNQLRAIANEEKLVYAKHTNGVPAEKPETRIFAQNNRIKALTEIVKNVERLTNMKMDLGLLERKLGTADFNMLDILAAVDYERTHGTIRPAKVIEIGDDRGGEGESGEGEEQSIRDSAEVSG